MRIMDVLNLYLRQIQQGIHAVHRNTVYRKREAISHVKKISDIVSYAALPALMSRLSMGWDRSSLGLTEVVHPELSVIHHQHEESRQKHYTY